MVARGRAGSDPPMTECSATFSASRSFLSSPRCSSPMLGRARREERRSVWVHGLAGLGIIALTSPLVVPAHELTTDFSEVNASLRLPLRNGGGSSKFSSRPFGLWSSACALLLGHLRPA